MHHPSSNNPHDDQSSNDRDRMAASEHAGVESKSSPGNVEALEGLLKSIGQDCRKESVQYLERTQVWQQGE